jgi:hypothetical protein
MTLNKKMDICYLTNKLSDMVLTCGHSFDKQAYKDWQIDRDEDCPACFDQEEEEYDDDSDDSIGSLVDFVVHDVVDAPKKKKKKQILTLTPNEKEKRKRKKQMDELQELQKEAISFIHNVR